MRVERNGATYCGRQGCSGWFGIICELVSGRRVHLVEAQWRPSGRLDGLGRRLAGEDAPPYFHLPRRRHAAHSFAGTALPDDLLALEPDAVLMCPKCGAVQILPSGVSEGYDPSIRLAAGVRIRPGEVRARVDTSQPDG
jgi:hypothetical protein